MNIVPILCAMAVNNSDSKNRINGNIIVEPVKSKSDKGSTIKGKKIVKLYGVSSLILNIMIVLVFVAIIVFSIFGLFSK